MDTPNSAAGPLGTDPQIPSEQTPSVDVTGGYDPAKEVADTTQKFTKWATQRRPFEAAWFLNTAFLRGQQRVEYNDALAKLVTPVVPSSRVSMSINRIRPKVQARLSKFFKNRPRPVVIPASTDHTDVLNARATEQFLTYQWYRQHLEEKYKDARIWATTASKGFLWIRWNDAAEAKVQTGPGGQGEVVPLGDIEIEAGSPFEIYPSDNTLSRIGQQPEFIRAKMRLKSEVKARYPNLSKIDEEATSTERPATQRTIDRLGTLNKRPDDRSGGAPVERLNQVLVLEHFVAPCGKYPKGRYKVIVGTEVARLQEELPHEFHTHPDNPYPVVEFADTIGAGQFWNTTLVEQLIDLQREYNFIRSLISENLRMMARPKIIVYKQHNLAEGAFTNAPGEILELSWIPGLPPPQILQPANIANDAWQLLALISREFDDLSLIYPSSVGKTADATSGYQTNLLQEATDGVHAPDIRNDELAIQELAWKMRRLAKLTYTEPRLIAVLGDNSRPMVQAFSQNQIDEFAEVRIQAGSMLPDLKSARIQLVQTMFKDGMFGNPQDPTVRKRVLNLLEMGGIESVQEEERADRDEAFQEEAKMDAGEQIHPAQFYQDHVEHLQVHQNEMKSSHFQSLPPQVQQAKVAHTITHLDWVQPVVAQALRQQYGLMDLPVATPPPPPMPAAPPAPPPSSGAPLSATPQTQAPPPA